MSYTFANIEFESILFYIIKKIKKIKKMYFVYGFLHQDSCHVYAKNRQHNIHNNHDRRFL